MSRRTNIFTFLLFLSTLIENDRKITYIQTEAKIEPPQYLSINIIPPISLPL